MQRDRQDLLDELEERESALYAAKLEEVEQEMAADPLVYFASAHDEAMRRLRAGT